MTTATRSFARPTAPACSLLAELVGNTWPPAQGEYFDPPLISPGIPGDNSLHLNAAAARQAAQAEANRLNANRPKTAGKYTYGVAHHAPKQPGDRGHYHVVDEGGQQLSGHFFYGAQPVKRQDRDYPTIAGRDRRAPAKGPFPPPRRGDQPADPAGYAQQKNQAAQRNYDHARAEWYEARVGKVEGRRGRNLRQGRARELAAAGGRQQAQRRALAGSSVLGRLLLSQPAPAPASGGRPGGEGWLS